MSKGEPDCYNSLAPFDRLRATLSITEGSEVL
jgi:hypothetical protein